MTANRSDARALAEDWDAVVASSRIRSAPQTHGVLGTVQPTAHPVRGDVSPGPLRASEAPRTRALPCACGGWIVADPADAGAALRAHHLTLKHVAWREIEGL